MLSTPYHEWRRLARRDKSAYSGEVVPDREIVQMNPGSVLEIQLKDSSHKPQSISDVSIDVVLLCGGRERYRFDAGKTDAQGRITACTIYLRVYGETISASR